MTTVGRKTILVAEDEASVRDLILTTLRRNGFSALSAADGLEAMQLIDVDGRRIDLLVTDVVMPRMDGAELARRARTKRPTLPIILMSGYGQWQLAPDSFTEDVYHLEKPFTARRLIALVRDALGG
jgi:two-component system, cell cycle sensor histidine kinase and response regulator CckA